MSATKKRSKVRIQCPEKLFYEKVMDEWILQINSTNHAYQIRKALKNLKNYPLNINGYTDLMKIKSIGADTATRLGFLAVLIYSNALDAAWTNMVTNHLNNERPTVADIKKMERKQAYHFLETAVPSKGKRNVPFVPRKPVEKTTVPSSQPLPSSQPQFLTQSSQVQPLQTQSQTKTSSQIPQSSPVDVPIITIENECEEELLSYDPLKHEGQLMLIVDGREQGLNARYKSVTQQLGKLKVPFEIRALSVGDYLWVVKMRSKNPNKSREYDELVLDYVVERKTWDDLKTSIHHTRYAEQKKRLKESGIRNVILVAEGPPTQNMALEQALVSTSIQDHFLVHRTTNATDTARFLSALCKRFTKRLRDEHFCGQTFEGLQNKSKKTKTMTVRDCWLRQLTICPQMSVEKAALVSDRFPTFRSLVEFYRCQKSKENLASNPDSNSENIDLLNALHNEIPQIPRALSTQIYQFFQNV